MSGAALVLDGVKKAFRQGTVELTVLNGADLALRAGELVALLGPSGAGKSTLLHLAGLLERPDGGEV
jgi:lipoprotein-releasing system ATP-binding protein